MMQERFKAPMPAEQERIRAMMDGELASQRFYEQLAPQFAKQQMMRLRQTAQEEARHLRALQMEYFLLTGDSYSPCMESLPAQSRLSALRSAYHEEMHTYENYMQAAQETASTALAAVFIANAADEARHAQMLREMIGRALG